jgi:hypothetical protein
MENCFLTPSHSALTTTQSIQLLLPQLYQTTSLSTEQLRNLSEGFLSYLQRLYASTLMNIALCISCKYETNQSKPLFISLRRKTNIQQELEHAASVGKKAIDIYSHPILIVKYIKLLEKISQ